MEDYLEMSKNNSEKQRINEDIESTAISIKNEQFLDRLEW
jgi:hypothetical protein